MTFTLGASTVIILSILYMLVGMLSHRIVGGGGFKQLWYVPELIAHLRRPSLPTADSVQLVARMDKDMLEWALPFTIEDQEAATDSWLAANGALGNYTFDEWLQVCAHEMCWVEVTEKAGFGEIVAAKCKRCRSSTIAVKNDWLDARYKLSNKDHQCRVLVTVPETCGCAICENRRRPAPQRKTYDSYTS